MNESMRQLHTQSGKGSRNRSAGKKYTKNYDGINWGPKIPASFKRAMKDLKAGRVTPMTDESFKPYGEGVREHIEKSHKDIEANIADKIRTQEMNELSEEDREVLLATAMNLIYAKKLPVDYGKMSDRE